MDNEALKRTATDRIRTIRSAWIGSRRKAGPRRARTYQTTWCLNASKPRQKPQVGDDRKVIGADRRTAPHRGRGQWAFQQDVVDRDQRRPEQRGPGPDVAMALRGVAQPRPGEKVLEIGRPRRGIEVPRRDQRSIRLTGDLGDMVELTVATAGVAPPPRRRRRGMDACDHHPPPP